jgi:protease I
VKAWKFTDWGDKFPVDIPLRQARADDFDALLLPGGVINPDTLPMLPEAMAFAKAFFDSNKPVAAICHGPWTVIEVGLRAGGESHPGLRSRPTSGTLVRNGWIRRSSSIGVW